MQITDKDRLDFLEKNKCDIYSDLRVTKDLACVVEIKDIYFEGKTMREAIDNAIRAMKEK